MLNIVTFFGDSLMDEMECAAFKKAVDSLVAQGAHCFLGWSYSPFVLQGIETIVKLQQKYPHIQIVLVPQYRRAHKDIAYMVNTGWITIQESDCVICHQKFLCRKTQRILQYAQQRALPIIKLAN